LELDFGGVVAVELEDVVELEFDLSVLVGDGGGLAGLVEFTV
jgi:hypothetical protein